MEDWLSLNFFKKWLIGRALILLEDRLLILQLIHYISSSIILRVIQKRNSRKKIIFPVKQD